MGSIEPEYSVPSESKKLLQKGLAENLLVDINGDLGRHIDYISYTGSDLPSIPINWRLAESVSALKGLEAATVNLLLERRYGVKPSKVLINTDHAQLFFMSAVLYTVDPTGDALSAADTSSIGKNSQKMAKYFPNCDKHRANSSPYRSSATNIYKTKDNRYFHLHGSMNPDITLRDLGLPLEQDFDSLETATQPFKDAISQVTSSEIDQRSNEVCRQPGTICWTREEYANSEHGRLNASKGLFEIHYHENPTHHPTWWPSQTTNSLFSPSKPLAGLKIVDLTRVIAGPSITRGLAELGASIMRVTSPNISDMSPLHPDLNWGKWNCHLDFNNSAHRKAMTELILGADVIVDSYRPGVMEKWGFGFQQVLGLLKDRAHGIIYVRENCYGWHGPWADRCGWQQISDACTGVSIAFGNAMGLNEPVTPVFPNSDYCTGICGVVGVLQALMQRAQKGGSYSVDVALNYYNSWLVNSVGEYPEAVWQEVWDRVSGKQVFHHYHSMMYTLPRYLGMLSKKAGGTLFREEFFEERHSRILGVGVRTVRPILSWEDGSVKPGFNVGTRGNGVDRARWPEDLGVEVVV